MEKAKEGTDNRERIKIERRNGDHYSYFVDANGLLQGEWGGFEELYEYGPNGEAMFEIIFALPANFFCGMCGGYGKKQ